MTDETSYSSRRERRYAAERALAETPPLDEKALPPSFMDVSPPEEYQTGEPPGPWTPVAVPITVHTTPATEGELTLYSGWHDPEEATAASTDGSVGGTPLEQGAPKVAGRRQRREQAPKLSRKDLRSQRLENRRWWRPIVEVLAVIVAAALVAVIIKSVAFRTFDVPSESMNPTLITNDRILVEMVTPHFDAYKRGDVVVFRDTEDWLNDGSDGDGDVNALQLLGVVPESTGYIVKRVLAVPGETIEGLADGTLLVNGKKLNDTYSPRIAQEPFIWTLSDGEYWMMGDNRGNSADSRMHGPVDGSEFVGRVAFTFYPFERAGAVD